MNVCNLEPWTPLTIPFRQQAPWCDLRYDCITVSTRKNLPNDFDIIGEIEDGWNR